MTTEELRIVLTASGASQTGQAIKHVTTRTNEFNASLGSLYGTLAKFMSIGLIGKFAKDCVNAASDLQEVANVMDVTFGDKASQIDQWAKTQAASFGLSETAAKRYAGNIGTMAKQFGFTTEQAAAMSIQLTKLTGDVSSFYNLQDSVAYTKFKSIFTGETESLKELGVVMTEAQLNAYAMQQGIGKQVKEMTEGEKVMLRYKFVTDKLSHANDDFIRTQDGFANTSRTLKLQLENLKVEIGNELIPVASYGLQLISDGLRVISPILVGIAQTVRVYTDAWKNADSVTKAYVKTALGFIAIMIIAPKVIGLVSAAVAILTAETISLASAVSLLAGLAAVLLLGDSLIRLTDQLNNTSDDMSDTAENIQSFSDVADTTSGFVDSLADSINGLGESTKDLDLFLASFDEVNKVGGSDTLMSRLINADDIANIYDAQAGLEKLDNTINNFGKKEEPEIRTGILGFMDEVKEAYNNYQKLGENSVLTPAIKAGKKSIDMGMHPEKYNEHIIIPPDDEKWFSPGEVYLKEAFSGKSSIAKYVAEQYRNVYGLSYADYQNKNLIDTTNAAVSGKGSMADVVKQATGAINGTASAPVINFNPTIQIDGDKITSKVIGGINQKTRSNGRSPLIEMG